MLIVVTEPGGSVRVDGGESGKITRTDLCVFCAEDNPKALQAYYEVQSSFSILVVARVSRVGR